MSRLSRREFVRAASAAAGVAALPSSAAAQSKVKLEAYFLGLCFVEESASAVSIGFVNEPMHHQPIVVVEDNVLQTVGPDRPKPQEWKDWALPETRFTFDKHTLYRPSSSLKITMTSGTALSGGIDRLFPATNAGKPLRRWRSGCKHDFAFTNGAFESIGRKGTMCEHPNVTWEETDGTNVHTRRWRLNDIIAMTADVTKFEVKVDGKEIPFKPAVPLRVWLGNMLTDSTGVDKTEAEHCRHYFSLLEGSPTPFWPKRLKPLPVGCSDSDPVFCPPGF